MSLLSGWLNLVQMDVEGEEGKTNVKTTFSAKNVGTKLEYRVI
jgi:hypothetical protein